LSENIIVVPAPASADSLAPDNCGSVSLARAWTATVVLCLFYVLSMMDRGVIALMVSPIMRDLTISPVGMGIVQGFAFAGVYSLAGLPLGWAADRFSRRKLLAAGILTWSAGAMACGLADSFAGLMVARAVVGLGEATLVPTALSLIADLFSGRRVATATAVFSSGATIGSAAALIVGGLLLERFQSHAVSGALGTLPAWKSVFFAFAAFGLLAACLTALVPDVARGGSRSRRVADHNELGRAANESETSESDAGMAEFGRFLRRHAALLAYVFVAFPLLTAVLSGFLAWAPHHFETAFSWNARTVGVSLGAMKLIACPLGVICGGLAMDKLVGTGLRSAYFLVPLVTTALGAPLLVAGLVQDSASSAIGLIVPGLFLFSAFGSSHYVVVQRLAPPSQRGRLAALYLMVLSLIGAGIGALLPPILNDLAFSHSRDLGRGTAVAIAMMSLVAVAALALGRSRLSAALAHAS